MQSQNIPAAGQSFNDFVKAIEQPAVFILDEFEKVYDGKQQEALLTLLDGTYMSKKMFLLTANDASKVNQMMINRPGRIFYNINFKGLDTKFVVDYCEDKLDDKSKMEGIIRLSSIISEFNFDMLQAIVEELNRYPHESLKEVLTLLNVQMDYVRNIYYGVNLFHNDIPVGHKGSGWRLDTTSVNNPFLQENFEIEIYREEAEEGATVDTTWAAADEDWHTVTFDLTEEVVVAKDGSRLELRKDDWKLVLQKPKPRAPAFSYLGLGEDF